LRRDNIWWLLYCFTFILIIVLVATVPECFHPLNPGYLAPNMFHEICLNFVLAFITCLAWMIFGLGMYNYSWHRQLPLYPPLLNIHLSECACTCLFAYISYHLLGKVLICMEIVYRRGSGGRGFTSGAGETELQLQRRRFAPRVYFCFTLKRFFLEEWPALYVSGTQMIKI